MPVSFPRGESMQIPGLGHWAGGGVPSAGWRVRKDGLAGGLRVLSEKGTGKLAEGW